MKKRALSICSRLWIAGAFVLTAVWLVGCGPRTEVPAPILPPQSITEPETRTSTTEPMPESTPVSTVRSTPTSTSISAASETTISNDEPGVVTFNPDETKIGLVTVAEGLNNPLFVTNAGDGSGRLFVVEQPGIIRIFVDGEMLETPFLNITDRVNDGKNEQGLLGLAFAPDYAESGLLFVNYTDSDGNTVVARYLVSADDPNLADAQSEAIVLEIEQPASNHNGGMIAFGPDRMLYVGMGDGGGANDRYQNGQNPDSLLGKMLRIDVLTEPGMPYLIPQDNPWAALDWAGRDVRDEVWAVGLRNPWRFSFDRQTGDLWIGDVGQNQYEEINFVPATVGQPINFGWPIMEATHCFGSPECEQAGLWLPVAETDHQGNCSITGGHVYRGQTFPALNGVYFFGDYCSGKIWATLPDPDSTPSEKLVTQQSAALGTGWHTVELLDTDFSFSSFGEDEAGELYVTDLRGGNVSRLIVLE